MDIDRNDTLLFIGDSITDCGRGRPIGKKPHLGNGYVSITSKTIETSYPRQDIRILNMGVGGDRITDLQKRWQKDVLDLKPEWLSVMIGINDVWRQFDRPLIEQVDIRKFETVYNELLQMTITKLKGLVLMTPYVIESNKADPMRNQMDRYSEVVKLLAKKFGAVLVDTQTAFDKYLESHEASSLCSDRIHPNTTGHRIISDAFISETILSEQLTGPQTD